MFQTARAVFSLLLSYGLLLLANGLFGTLLGVRATLEGFPTAVTGVVMSGHFIGLFLGGLGAIRVVASVGHIRAFAAFASIMSVAALGHVLVVQPVAWFALRVVTGFCMAGMIMVTESWLNERSERAVRGQVLALYMITNYLGSGLGQFLLPLADPGEFQLFCVASIVYSLALVPVLLSTATAPQPARAVRASFSALWRTSPLGLIGACCAGLNNASFFSLGAVYAQRIGLDLAATSTFMGSVIFGGLLLQWPVGRLSDHVDRRWVLVAVGFTASAASVGLVAAGSGPLLYAAAGVYGGVSFTVYSLCVAHTNEFADPSARVQTASGLLIAYSVGAVIGPILVGLLMGTFAPRAMFLHSAAVMGGLGLFALFRMTRRRTPAPQARPGVINLPGGTFTAGQLYAAVRDAMDRRRSPRGDGDPDGH
jgi:MFS family permease